MTGVSIASAAAFSRIAYPEMKKVGYKQTFALGAVAGSACLGMLIPPSVLLIVWAILTEMSVGALFVAGIIPGIMLAVLFAGYVIISPNGLVRTTGFLSTGWSFRPEGPQQRDELAFAREVIADAVGQFSIDPDRLLITGFSIGGSLVWYLACKEPQLGAAYAPLAGGFWRPLPKSCAGPIDLLQTHGWRDQTVPLEGRPLRGGEIYQGDIFEGLQIWRAIDGCRRLRADNFETGAVYWVRTWSECDSGRELALALHPGDHDTIPEGWAERARTWFERRIAAQRKRTHSQ